MEEAVDKILEELSANNMSYGWVQTFADGLNMDTYKNLLGNTTVLGQALCGLFALAFVCRIVWKSWANGSQIDIYKALKPCAVGIAIMFFGTLVDAVDFLSDSVCKATQTFKDDCSKQSSDQFKRVIGFVSNTNMVKTENGQENIDDAEPITELKVDETTNKIDEDSYKLSIKGILTKLLHIPDQILAVFKQACNEAVRSIFVLFASVVCCCILCMGFIGRCVFYFVGPILFAMELIPGMEGRIAGWFKKYLTFSLYPSIINLVSGVMTLLMVTLTDSIVNFEYSTMPMKVGQMGYIQFIISFIAAFMFMSIPSVANQIMDTAANSLGGSGMKPVSWAAGKVGDRIASNIGSGAAAAATGGASKAVEVGAKMAKGAGEMAKQASKDSNFSR